MKIQLLRFMLSWILVGIGLSGHAQITWQSYPDSLSPQIAEQLRFGMLTVPESRDKSDSREIQTAFTILKSKAETPKKDAVILLPGGPGVGYSPYAVQIMARPLIQTLLEERDVVLYDPRGCGFSQPSLCPFFDSSDYRYGSIIKRGAELESFLRAAMEKCASLLTYNEVDFEAYNSIEIAHDVEVLRQALGYEQWNLKGQSYGSKFAQTVMQLYPQTVRSIILSGVVDPQEDRINDGCSDMYGALTKVIQACELDPACQASFPDLKGDLFNILTRTKDEPVPIPSYVTEDLMEGTYFLGPENLVSGMFTLLYSRQGIEIMPLLIHSLAEGKEWIFPAMFSPVLHEFDAVEGDMQLIISANDFPPKPYESQYDQSSDSLAQLIEQIYMYLEGTYLVSYWELLEATDSISSFVLDTTSIPTLMVSGEFDPITPPHIASSLKGYYQQLSHVVVPGHGHFAQATVSMMQAAFIHAPEQDLDQRELETLAPIQFYTEVAFNKGLSTAMAYVSSNRLAPFTFLGIAGLLSVFGLLFFTIRGFRGLFNRALTSKPKGQNSLFGGLSVLAVGTLLVYGWGVFESYSSNPYLLALGLPKAYGFVDYIVYTLWGLGIICLIVLLRHWQQATAKVPSILTWLGGAGVGGGLLWLGMG